MESAAVAERFGGNVRDVREKQGLTQLELSRTVDKSQQWLGKVEKGTMMIGLDDAIALADALGVSLLRLAEGPPAPLFESIAADAVAWLEQRDKATAKLAELDRQVEAIDVRRRSLRSDAALAAAQLRAENSLLESLQALESQLAARLPAGQHSRLEALLTEASALLEASEIIEKHESVVRGEHQEAR